jgi:hypothetical protein
MYGVKNALSKERKEASFMSIRPMMCSFSLFGSKKQGKL